jgi:hypothetical protein
MTDQTQQPQTVQPSPVPATWQTSTVPVPGGGQVMVIVIASPTGQAVYFLDPDEALIVANQIRNTARQAKSGLILPPTVNGKGGIL